MHRDLAPITELAAFSARHHIRRLSLFGSVLHGDATAESDIDVLVEFEAGHNVGLLGLVEMERELSQIFNARVDLRTPGDLSQRFRDVVLREAEVLYDAA